MVESRLTESSPQQSVRPGVPPWSTQLMRRACAGCRRCYLVAFIIS